MSSGIVMKKLLLLLTCLSAQAQTNTPVPVTTQALADVVIERRLTANAEVTAKHISTLSGEVSAVVKAVHVDTGDAVSQGQLLISLDDTDLSLQVEQAEANTVAAEARLAQAELRLQRANQLQASQYISADDLLARETDVAVLKADLQSLKVALKVARRNLEKTRIVAPFVGVVASRQAQLGQWLSVGTPLLSVAQTGQPQILARIPSQLAADLSHADQLLFVGQNQQVPVSLIQLSPVIDNLAGVQTARFSAADALPIGLTGELVWILKGQLLPADLVIKRQGQLGVFLAEGSVARFQPLPDAQEGRPVPLAEVPDWQVIIGGRERLQDQQAIQLK
jgi:RND family efflux transporter MFP subunit